MILNSNDWLVLWGSLGETLLLVGISGFFALILGAALGLWLFALQEVALSPNRLLFTLINAIINTLRAVPFVVLLIVMLPLTARIMGTILGYKAALPTLIVAVVPFYARMVYVALNELPKGVIEAMQAMGLARRHMIFLLLQEARSALVGGFTITLVTLVGFVAAAVVIGSGGLGATAYIKGFQRNNLALMYMATLFMILLVFLIQFLGDWIGKKLSNNH